MIIDLKSQKELEEWGQKVGSLLFGGEIIELIGDVGVGKTTLTKAIATSLAIKDTVQSPSFTICRVYLARDGISLYHYDFYRLNDVGIMAEEIKETLLDPKNITIVEWGSLVKNLLPTDRLVIRIDPLNDISRRLRVESGGDVSRKLMEKLQ